MATPAEQIHDVDDAPALFALDGAIDEEEFDEAEDEPSGLNDVVGSFLKQLQRYPLLTAAEEIALGRRVQAGDLAARSRFVECNLRLAVSVAKRYQGQGLDLGELIGAASLGLIRAVEKFDPERGFKFSTYATPWCHQAVQRALADTGRLVRIPVHRGQELRALRQTETKLRADGQNPTDEALAAAVGITTSEVADLRRAGETPVSLDAALLDGDGSPMLELLADDAPATEDKLAEAQLDEAVASALKTLPPKERKVVELRYGLSGGDELSLAEAALRLRVSRAEVRQLERRALQRLEEVTDLRALVGTNG